MPQPDSAKPKSEGMPMFVRCPECENLISLPEFKDGQGRKNVMCNCGKYAAEMTLKRVGPALCQLAIDPGMEAE